jgi:hypothetical protein
MKYRKNSRALCARRSESELFSPRVEDDRAESVAIVVAVEKGSAARGKAYFGIMNFAPALEVNITVDHRVFPNRVAWARALPRVHGLGVGSPAICDPGEKFEHQ